MCSVHSNRKERRLTHDRQTARRTARKAARKAKANTPITAAEKAVEKVTLAPGTANLTLYFGCATLRIELAAQ